MRTLESEHKSLELQHYIILIHCPHSQSLIIIVTSYNNEYNQQFKISAKYTC